MNMQNPSYRALWIIVLNTCLINLGHAGTAAGTTNNQLPNPEFRGTTGAIAAAATGEAPALWRTFAIGTDTASSALVPLAADELFPGSPPVNAVQLTVSNFGPDTGDDSGFDSSPFGFSMQPEQIYRGAVYLRSANADLSSQSITISLPIFDASDVFTGDFSVNVVQATETWTRFEGPEFSTSLIGASAEFSIRVNDSGSDNSVLIAMPEVAGPTLENRVPNPEFMGENGISFENVTGTVPDQWRAFGLNSEGASINLQIVPLAAGELYPGSPATNAVRISTSILAGSGFDHQNTVFSMNPAGRKTWGEVFLRADNADDSEQGVSVALPLFNPDGMSPGQPGSVGVNVGPQWNYYAGLPFVGSQNQSANIAFRLADSGAENALLIALPKVNYLSDSLFANGFEGSDPSP